MEGKFTKELVNNTYKVTVEVTNIDSSNYLEGIHDYGEDFINFGGKVLDDDGSTVLVSLSDHHVKLSDLSTSPYVQEFQISQYKDNTKKVAEQWIAGIKKIMDDYIKEVCAKIDDFSGVDIIQF